MFWLWIGLSFVAGFASCAGLAFWLLNSLPVFVPPNWR